MMMDDDVSFDAIVSGEAPAETTTTAPETTTEKPGQARDDQGRFANDQTSDQTAQAAVEGNAAPATTEPAGTVPQQALHEARAKEKAERDRADRLERELAQLRQPAAAKPQEPAKPKNFWESPDEFLAERTAPIEQKAQQRHMMTSRMLAEDKFGKEAVKEADDALGALFQANQNDPEVISMAQKVATSVHPYRDLVDWHENRKRMAEIGNDPVAFRARIEAEALAKYGLNPDGTPLQPAPATPAPAASTTTSAPLTKLPKSLSQLPGGGNSAPAADQSDAGLFTALTGG